MCFSPEVDLAAGVTVGAVAVDALRHVARPRQLLIAFLPLLLATHQLDEVLVWWGLEGRVSESAGQLATVVYLTFAFVLPLLVPLALIGVEPSARRRAVMTVLAAVGGFVSAVNLVAVLHGPTSAAVAGHHIAYTVDVGAAAIPLSVLYVTATCGSLLAASERRIVAYGAGNLVVVCLLAWVMVSGLTSLWCVWAAVTSIGVALYLRRANVATPCYRGMADGPG